MTTSEFSAAINHSGYTDNVYSGKQEHRVQVCGILEKEGEIPSHAIEGEVAWFYDVLGLDDMYFMREEPSTVAEHITAIYGSELSSNKMGKSISVSLATRHENSAMFIHNSTPGISKTDGDNFEKMIDTEYLDISVAEKAYRVESYRSRGKVSKSLDASLRTYFVNACEFVNPDPQGDAVNDINQVSDRTFLAKATPSVLDLYGSVVSKVLTRTGPVIVSDELPSGEHRIVIGYRQRSTQGYFSALSDLYHYYSMYSSRKYVEQFSNGVTVISLSASPVLSPATSPTSIEDNVNQIKKEASLLFCIPNTPFQNLFKTGELSVQETVYGYTVWIFAQHFLNRLGNEYATLVEILNPTDATAVEVLAKLKKRLRQETFTRELILDILLRHRELLKDLYAHFAQVHHINTASPTTSAKRLVSELNNDLHVSLSAQRLQDTVPLSTEDLRVKIARVTTNEHDAMVMRALLDFNENVLKTNFYQPTKVALSFRMDPSFLPAIEYPVKPYGLFLVIGNEFRGFHVRFQDVARGGIRIVRSRNAEAFSINQRTLFDENYSLASTQHRKNKDIPEGGSKGTILLGIESQDKAFIAFEKYVDAMLDLLLVGQSPGIKNRLVDRLGRDEILFFGPDEGTAGYMDWASQHARKRGAPFWKAFTTGKSQTLGGIPHDTYGMTTRSVHQYVLGIIRQLNLDESACTKLQTGGPDGDLGSNEIKISNDRTTAVVDGSGVLYDPHGINREELTRLALARQMIQHFDTSKLSPEGFRVLVDDFQVTLPNGTLVQDGLSFRNVFHLNKLAAADFFVPCGGRPESIDINNIGLLFDAEGTPRFKYVVEGANLFFTQDARLRLEKAGVHLFKDASANKGGVTSSSLEVLAALSFTDAEFGRLMCKQADGTLPSFYQEYVSDVQKFIEANAAREFECLWNESKRTGKPKSILSDELSVAIVELRKSLESTDLWNNIALRRLIMQEALPARLLKELGLDTVLERVPLNYLKAIFGAYLASHFVYEYGTDPSQFSFFEFMSKHTTKAEAAN
ncbi:Glutamate/Leucine/Phenylalanine/Valine dehydrogenase-domain-containing protein [Kickxella alabastrina]|uniref:Glutamate/Leucine/Phenylalanine/Valine dehydrogenase-domain-containing protein n=1 Tax=Kickxella alabastrina TaxID=61397 RepID=UPI00221F3F29|nr:Glutamate/Leucine/Phenylalanine/Valine dehydrogenase-domain-containing protein [Kickxella alabastrina]KAI7830006.1 Glutamate/Leucine/Phenylalanine/Valine dehydrogenase-domain-containing protein [Kickxella alabastrina]